MLANEEVIDGVSERGGHPVVRMPMKQWMLKITAYGDRQALKFCTPSSASFAAGITTVHAREAVGA